MVRLQAQMGAQGLWGCGDAPRAVRPHLAAGYCPLQQVSDEEMFKVTPISNLKSVLPPYHFQCRWKFRGYARYENHSGLHWSCRVEAPSYL